MMAISMLPANALALDLGGAAAVGSEAAVEESVVDAPVVEETAGEPTGDGDSEVITEAALRSAIAEGRWCELTSDITLTADLTVPAGSGISIAEGVTLTVPKGVKLINNGSIDVYSGGKIKLAGTISGRSSIFTYASTFQDLQMVETLSECGAPSIISIVEGNITLRDDLVVHSGVQYAVQEFSTLTVPKGVTLTTEAYSEESDYIGMLSVYGKLVVKGTLCNNGYVSLNDGGSIDMSGSYSGLSEIQVNVYDQESLDAAVALQESGVHVAFMIFDDFTLSEDLTISEESGLYVWGSLIVPKGVVLTNKGICNVGSPEGEALLHIKGQFVNNGSVNVWGDGKLVNEGVYSGSGNINAPEAEVIGIDQGIKAPEISLSCVASSGKPQLTWDAQSSAVKYEVWRATSKNGTYYRQGTTTGTSYTNTGAVAGKTYYYKVRAVDANGEYSEFSTVKNITCDYARPNVSITTNAETGKPKLTWDAVEGATKYEVYRATSKNGTYSKMYTTTGTTYNNTTAVAGKTYYYKVRALGASSYATSAYSTVDYITCDCAKPVVSISCNATTGKPKLTWSAVSGATKYEIWRATSKNGTYTKIYTTSNTYFNNTAAEANKSYYYKVRAIGGSSYATSAYSTMVSITCDCARPVVSITTNSSGKPKLTWSAVDGATKYEIWRATSSGGTYTKIYTTSNTYFNNTSAVAGKTYYYKVRAIGSSSYATSAYSTVKSITCK